MGHRPPKNERNAKVEIVVEFYSCICRCCCCIWTVIVVVVGIGIVIISSMGMVVSFEYCRAMGMSSCFAAFSKGTHRERERGVKKRTTHNTKEFINEWVQSVKITEGWSSCSKVQIQRLCHRQCDWKQNKKKKKRMNLNWQITLVGIVMGTSLFVLHVRKYRLL